MKAKVNLLAGKCLHWDIHGCFLHHRIFVHHHNRQELVCYKVKIVEPGVDTLNLKQIVKNEL